MRRFLVSLAFAAGVGGPACAAQSAGAQPQRAHRAAASPQRALQNSLAGSLRSAGGATGAYVVDLTAGRTLYAARATTLRLPASVEKIYTTSTALARYGANARLKTLVRGVGSLDSTGTWHGTLYLKGGGDPTFGSASFDRDAYGGGATMQRLVANLIRQTGIESVRGRIVGDESMLDSLRGTPATGFAASNEVEGMLSGLIYDRGLATEQGTAYQKRPALFSAQRFAEALRAADVDVPRQTRIYTGISPASARTLSSVNSPRLATLIRVTNTPSDNFFAEMLIKDMGARYGGRGSTAAGASGHPPAAGQDVRDQSAVE